ncbi:MAG: hypothetical protein JO247_05995 [Chloroflexi bacterium]|nr:hypothetical protein [Chloroflexota bacterium]
MNTSSEYVSSAAVVHVSAAIAHLTADGSADAPVPANVRIYHWAGTQHAPSDLPTVPDPRGAYFPNTADYKPFIRAAVDNMAAWITKDAQPPASCYPRVADGTLVTRSEVRARLPRLPGPGLPARKHQAVRSGDGGFDAEPGDSAAPDLIPAIDADANEVAGLRLPDVSVPLATYTAWNPRRPETGAPELLVRALGATIPFAPTAEERAQRDDPRPSIAERYASKQQFLDKVRAAAEELVEQRYMLAGDVAALVEASAQRWDDFMALERALP